MCADIVIVGGGPIGCWTAIQIKKRNPALAVQIYERHEEYQRDHMMSIERGSFESHSKSTGDALEKELFAKISAAHSSARASEVKDGLRDTTFIRTLDLEAILKEHCQKLGVNIAIEKIEKPEDVMAKHPECSRFVAADGAHSLMRTALLGENSTYSKDLLPSVDIKYKSTGQPKYLMEPTYDKIDMIVVETVGKEENGETSVALRFLVDNATLDQMKHATFKQPMNIDRFEIDARNNPKVKKLYDNFKKFQSLRAEFANEVKVPGSEVITKIKLSQYASKKFAVTAAHEKQRRGWFFAGDAAMGMPFYHSINSGLMLGSQLGAILSSPKLPLAIQTGAYNTIRPFKLAREFGAVAAKLAGINLYRNVLRPCLKGAAIVIAVPVLAPIVIAVAIPAAAALWVASKLGFKVRLM